MGESSLQDFQRCRLCALPFSSNSLIAFSNTIYEPMIDKLRPFGVNIKRDDGLPESICNGCTSILETFIETMELFLEADKKFKKLLEASKPTIIEKPIHEKRKSIKSTEDKETKGLKRKVEEEVVEIKRTKRRDHLNLLRKMRTPAANHSKDVDGKSTKEKCKEIANAKNDLIEQTEIKNNKDSGVRQKQERKQTLETRESEEDSENNISDEVTAVNVTEKQDHDYSLDADFNVTDKTGARNNSNDKEEIDISQESDHETRNKQIPLKPVKILTIDRKCLPEKDKVNLPGTSNPVSRIYTQPSDDKEIDIFICLECHQLSWNRETTLEHIYKQHAGGALTYKARYMVKRINHTKGYNSQKQIVCMLCYFTFSDSDFTSYLEHLTGHYMAMYKCVHCAQNFSSKEALEKHKRLYKNDIITCKICNESMALEFYAGHQRSHSLSSRTLSKIKKKALKRKESKLLKQSKEKSKKSVQINDNEKGREKILKNPNTLLKSKTAVESDLETVIIDGEVQIDEIKCKDNENSSKTDDEIQEISQEKSSNITQKKRDPCFYKCTNCLRIFQDRGTILKHIQRIHPLIWGNKKSLLGAKKLKSEDQEEDANEIYMCRICPVDFDNDSTYFQHLKMNHHCNKCTKTFYDKEEMNKHLRAHEKRLHICELCDASFYVEKNYLDHKLTHNHNCELCKSSYRSYESLVNHKKLSHPKISCPICLLSFDSPALLSKHDAMHSKKKTPTLCELCGKSYTSQSRFNYHMFTHNKNSEFSCQFCPKSFKNTASLKKHQRFSHLYEYTESLRENSLSDTN